MVGTPNCPNGMELMGMESVKWIMRKRKWGQRLKGFNTVSGGLLIGKGDGTAMQ